MKAFRKSMALLAVLMSGGVWATGNIAVTDVTWSQSGTRKAIIEYRLTGGESAVVTIDVRTNGVSIGEQNFTSLTGDVNMVVAPDAANRKRIVWDCVKDWPDRKIDSGVSVEVTAWALDNPPDYLVVDVTSGARRYYTSTNALPEGGLANDIYKTEKLVMRRIPAAGKSFIMGAPTFEANYVTGGRELAHKVSFTNDFYMGIYEFTQKQYALAFPGNTPATPPVGDTLPVHNINYVSIRGAATSYSWPQNGHAVSLAGNRAIGNLRNRSGLEIDIPTESQWEFACRAGTTTAYNTGLDTTDVTELAKFCWFVENTSEPQVVGQFAPNAWGLYDMHGNVWETCLDWYATDETFHYNGAETVDPIGPSSGSDRVMRGGAYSQQVGICRTAFRGHVGPSQSSSTIPDIGFRVVCPAVAR